jgi:hypothetical protein
MANSNRDFVARYGIETDNIESHTGIHVTVDGIDLKNQKAYWDNINSSGKLWGGNITNNGNNTITVTFGEGLIKTEEANLDTIPTSINNGQGSSLIKVNWETKTLTLTMDTKNYIYYNHTINDIDITTNFNLISSTQDFLLGEVFENTDQTIISLSGCDLWNFNKRLQLFIKENFSMLKTNGIKLFNPYGLYIGIESGIVWVDLNNRFIISTFNSSQSDTFSYYYSNGSGGWNKVNGYTQIDNMHYDNGSGTLTTLSNNNYTMNWIYITFDGNVHVVYHDSQYNKIDDIPDNIDPPTSLPNILSEYGILIGKVIFMRSATSLNSLENL